MKPLDLDYAQPSTVSGRWNIGLFLVGLLLLALIFIRHYALKEEISNLEGRNTHLPIVMQTTKDTPSVLENTALEDEFRRINNLVYRLAAPWEELFASLENSRGSDIVLLSLDIDGINKGKIVIIGEARDSAALVGYWQRLQAQDMFAQVILRNHKLKPPNQLSARPIGFEIDAQWIRWR